MPHVHNISRSILLVDDQTEVLESMRISLDGCGLDIVATTEPEHAAQLLKQQAFAVVISDQVMPGIDGLQLLAKARDLQPLSSLVLITGMPSMELAIEAVNSGAIFRFHTKPVRPTDLARTVSDAFSRYQLLVTNEQLRAEADALTASLQESNANLQEKVFELNEQKQQLASANDALARNFERSLDLCQRIISTYSPLIGKSTRIVVDICNHMAQLGDFSEHQQKVLMVSAWLHDIGLIGVSRELISRYRKRDKSLSDADRKVMESHPVYGEAIAVFVDNLKEVGATIRSHHERWDGSGYPDGLREESIPQMARYLAVACAYVESPLSREKAVTEIIDQSGKAFYPEAVRLFLKVNKMAPLPRQIREITFAELREGMTMASDLHTPNGLLLLPEGQRISEDMLLRMRHHNLVDSITDRILVFK
jgi:response regulator RpfG family c-di-GMP phosphodiesterase